MQQGLNQTTAAGIKLLAIGFRAFLPCPFYSTTQRLQYSSVKSPRKTAVSRLFHIDQNNIGVVGTNDYYSVERVSFPGGFGTAVTNMVGEFDFAIVPGD